MNNTYWVSKIVNGTKQVGNIKVGDKLHLTAPEMEAVCTIIGFDDTDIPIVRYDKVRYKSTGAIGNNKHGKNDLFRDGDIFAYPYTIEPKEIKSCIDIDMESIKGFIWDDINEE